MTDRQTDTYYSFTLKRTISDMKNRRYMLKSPLHLLNLHALTEVFPGAQLIFTHRKLTEVVPSFLSLTSTMHELYGGVADHQWRRRYGRAWVFIMYNFLIGDNYDWKYESARNTKHEFFKTVKPCLILKCIGIALKQYLPQLYRSQIYFHDLYEQFSQQHTDKEGIIIW